MKRKSKGSRGGAARGGGRGRGRGSRGGSRGGGVTNSDTTRDGAKPIPVISRGGRGRGGGSSHITRGNNHHINDSSPSKNIFFGPSSSSSSSPSYFRTKSVSEGDTRSSLFGPKSKPPPGDYYLHKKFKKLTNTLLEDDNAASATVAAKSSSSLSPRNGLTKPDAAGLGFGSNSSNGLSTQQHHNQHNGSTSRDNVKNCSAIEITTVIRQGSQSLENSSTSSVSSSGGHSQSHQTSSSATSTLNNSNMVYKPKFRIASESESSGLVLSASSHNNDNPTQNGVALSPPNSASISSCSSNQGDSDAGDQGKVSRALRPSDRQSLDRQSLDDRISKIIDDNNQALEWPEHFTKKLKSHTSRNTSSSSHHQRTNQLNISMSGGSTTELLQSPSSKSNPPTPLSGSGHTGSHHSQHHLNGLVRHSSFDMTTSGGTVEFLTNPLILKAQADMLKNAFSSSHGLQHASSSICGGGSGTSIADLVSFPLSVASNASSLMVPKKRRRLSPTPSRLCGGEVEVSELPVNEMSHPRNFYQDVHELRVNNCSGAKVTIRTSNGSGSGGSVQSGVSFGRYMEPANLPSPHLTLDGSSLFFPSNNTNNGPYLSMKRESDKMFQEREKDDFHHDQPSISNSGRGYRGNNTNKSPKRKNSRPSKTAMNTPEQLLSLPPPPQIPGPSSLQALDMKISRTKPSATLNVSPLSLVIPSAASSSFSKKGIHALPVATAISPPKRSPNLATLLPPPRELPSGLSLVNKETLTKDSSFQLLSNANGNPKRPNFLALKPVNNVVKKGDVGVLPSPETPRVAKSYNQMSINGNAYTYLGFKVSTRSSYTCLFKPQPMFIPQHSDPKLSMYSNWQPCPLDPKEPELSMSTCDSRINGRKDMKTLYTSAIGNNCDTLTVSSPDKQPPISSPMSEKSPLTALFSGNKVQSSLDDRSSVTSLSRSSEAVPPGKGIGFPTSFSTSTLTSSKFSSSMMTSQLAQCITTPSATALSSVNINSSVARAISILSSSSDLSSAEDEACRFNRVKRTKKIKNGGSDQGPLNSRSNSESLRIMREDSNSASDSIKSDGMFISQADGSRVRIMEGGFESNEAYTYVRGRGKGRFVCEACGIRCKKPSMLRKHLKTHTDLRPYTCKLCNFSFKTKGNLTKHQKSKSHHKKCISMGIHPESAQSLLSTGPNISDSNSENDSDDDDEDGDSDSQCDDGSPSTENESESVEKEIALSLLDLSRMSRRPSETESIGNEWSKKQQAVSTFPVPSTINETKKLIQSAEVPMDLSVKPKSAPTSTITTSALSGDEGIEAKRPKLELNGFVKSIGVVSEAQRWGPEEELISKGSFSLTKVLNTSTATGGVTVTSSNSNPAIAPTSAGTMNLDIKQEVFDYPGENGEKERSREEAVTLRPLNGFVSHHLSRNRQESETSNSSINSSRVSNTVSPSAEPQPSSSSPAVSGAGAGNGSGSVRLHQPWLSPPEKNKSATLEDVDGSKLNNMEEALDEETNNSKEPLAENSSIVTPVNGEADFPAASSSETTQDITTSPNGKIFTKIPPTVNKPQAEFRQPSGAQALVKEDGKAECNVCGKLFARPSQLTLHMNIHYLERPFRCDPCGVSFRTKGHLIKHRRSSSHDCKVYLTEAWGVANEENPRPFKCPECKIAFRIHGHLAKHLRSKMHIMRMECLGKLPFGIYFEMEKSGMNLNEIDTTDCDMSLVSLQTVARKIYGETWMERLTVPVEEPA